MTAAGFVGFRQRSQAALFGSMPDHLARLGWDGASVAAAQRDRLRSLLSVALERSPFHARRLGDIDPATFEVADLRRLPVMCKAEMMERFDEVVTDRRVTLASAGEAVARTVAAPVPIDGDVVVLASGGSSGRRGLFAFAAEEFAEFGCTLMRPAMARLQAAGMAGSGVEIAMVAAASAIHATGAAPQILDGSPVQFRPVPVTLPFDEIVRRLNELRAPMLYGYPSMLARLAVARSRGELAVHR